MDNGIGKRIKTIRKKIGYSQKEFAEKLGLKESVSISRWENGYRKPEYDILIKLSDLYDVNLHWLITGEGSELFTYAGDRDDFDVSFKYIPLIDVYAAAGGGYLNETDNIKGFIAFKKEWLLKNITNNISSLVLITVEGDSMEPTLYGGDLVLVDKSFEKVEKDGIYVILYDDLLLVKRVQRIISNGIEKIKFISDNKFYDTFTVTPGEDGNIRLIGKVVWFGRRL